MIALPDDEFRIGGITLTKTPALHGSNAAVAEKTGSVSGYLLKGEDKTLYIAGDTVFCREVEETPCAVSSGGHPAELL